MDQSTVVSEQTDPGQQLIKALAEERFDVRVAFWAKPTDEERQFLYLASPSVDEKGAAAAYRLVHDILRKRSLWIDPFDIRVIGLNDSLTEAILAATKSKVPNSPYAVQNPSPFPGMTCAKGTTFGGVSMDEISIYPPSR